MSQVLSYWRQPPNRPRYLRLHQLAANRPSTTLQQREDRILNELEKSLQNTDPMEAMRQMSNFLVGEMREI